jgi:hypothetical protein
VTMHCSICGKKVPKKRRLDKTSPYAGFFCSRACHVAYADKVITMTRESELEVEHEITEEIKSGQGPWKAIFEDLDEVAAEATTNAATPQEIAARFLGAMAGKLAPKIATSLYGRFAETAKAWKGRLGAVPQQQAPRPPQTSTPQPAPPPASQPSPGASGQSSGPKSPPRPQQAPSAGQQGNGAQQRPGQHAAQGQQQGQPKIWRRVPEPPDLEERPLEEQREWLLRRFYLPPSATIEDVRAKYKMLARKYHPDNRETGNARLMSVINASKQRLEEIEEELAEDEAPRRRKKR